MNRSRMQIHSDVGYYIGRTPNILGFTPVECHELLYLWEHTPLRKRNRSSLDVDEPPCASFLIPPVRVLRFFHAETSRHIMVIDRCSFFLSFFTIVKRNVKTVDICSNIRLKACSRISSLRFVSVARGSLWEKKWSSFKIERTAVKLIKIVLNIFYNTFYEL